MSCCVVLFESVGTYIMFNVALLFISVVQVTSDGRIRNRDIDVFRVMVAVPGDN